MATPLRSCFGLDDHIVASYRRQIQQLVRDCFPYLIVEGGLNLGDGFASPAQLRSALEGVEVDPEIPAAELEGMIAFVNKDSGDRLPATCIAAIVPDMILMLKKFGKLVTAQYPDYLPLSVHIYKDVSEKVSMGLLYKKGVSQSAGTPWHGAIESTEDGTLHRAGGLDMDVKHIVRTVQPDRVPFPLAYVTVATSDEAKK